MLVEQIDINEDLKMAHKLPLFNIKHDVYVVVYLGMKEQFLFEYTLVIIS